MKVEVKKDSQDTWLSIGGDCRYVPDYQVEMIRQARPAGFLPFYLTEEENENSAFRYKISNRTSLQNYYRKHTLDDKEILRIVEAILEVTDRARRYLLDPDRIVMNPACIFRNRADGELSFCYLPIYRRAFRESFHTLTEYFVRELDYGNMDAIQVACRLHKYTLEENYELGGVVQQVVREVEEKRTQEEKRQQEEERRMEAERESAGDESGENGVWGTAAKEQSRFRDGEERRTRRRWLPKKKKTLSKWGEWENL